MQDNVKKIKNPRKLLIYILLAVVLPLGILAVTAIAFNLEGKKFKFKINNKEVTYDKSDFDTLESYQAEFKKLAISKTKYYTVYKNKDDEKDKYNPKGYEVSFDLEAKLKDEQDVYNQQDGLQVYAVVSLPGTKKSAVLVDKNVKISQGSSIATFSSIKINKSLPHYYPFILPIKDVIVYFIIRVPYQKQTRVAEEEAKKGKSLTKEEKEKYTEYREFKFYWNFTKNTADSDKSTKVN